MKGRKKKKEKKTDADGTETDQLLAQKNGKRSRTVGSCVKSLSIPRSSCFQVGFRSTVTSEPSERVIEEGGARVKVRQVPMRVMIKKPM